MNTTYHTTSFTDATAFILIDRHQQAKPHYERQPQASTVSRFRRWQSNCSL